MSNRIERPKVTIKSIIAPLSTAVKTKVNLGIQQVINKIKDKHL